MKIIGGKVKRTPQRTITPTNLDINDKGIKKFDIPEEITLDDVIDKALDERDRIGGELLDLDRKYNILEDTIDDQVKDMNIPVTNRRVREAVRAFGGDDNITAMIYKKALTTARAISSSIGVNPLHVLYATSGPGGKRLTQHSGDIVISCGDIDYGHPNAKVAKTQSVKYGLQDPRIEDNIGGAGKNAVGDAMTSIKDLLDKATQDISDYLEYTIFWDLIYKKFLAKLILFHPKIWVTVLKGWVNKKIIGKYISVIYCQILKLIYFFENIPEIFGLRPPGFDGKKYIDKDGKNKVHLDFKYSEEPEYIHNEKTANTWDDVADNDTTRVKKSGNVNECSEEGKSSGINDNDNLKDRIDKIANKIYECSVNTYSKVVDEKDGETGEPTSDTCAETKTQVLVKEASKIMGTGIDTNVPANAGFIAPKCYIYADTILKEVKLDTIIGENDTYNPNAVMLNDLLYELRAYHEQSKSFVYMMDDSDISRKLLENTISNPIYKHMFMSKDQKIFRDSNIGGVV